LTKAAWRTKSGVDPSPAVHTLWLRRDGVGFMSTKGSPASDTTKARGAADHANDQRRGSLYDKAADWLSSATI
jgi:hypothetical protein